MSADKSKRIVEVFDLYKEDRDSAFAPMWQDVADYCQPRKSQIQEKKTPGEINYTDRLYNLTMGEALTTLASGITTASTPATDHWAAYKAPAALRRRRGGVGKADKWYAECTHIAMEQLAESNFYSEIYEHHLERSAFGTGAIFVREGKRSLLNFKTIPVGTYVIAEDDEGFVTTFGREFELSAEQALGKWTAKNLGPTVLAAAEGSSQERKRKFMFIHWIEPRSERDRDRADKANKAFADYYVCRQDPEMYIEGGFDEFPVPVSRFFRWPGELWGWGPGVEALPLGRQLNFIERLLDTGLEKQVDPPVLIPSYLAGQVDMRAAGETIFDENKSAMPKEWQQLARLDMLDARIERKEEMMRRIFHNDLFRAISDIDPGKMTATETMQRVSEKMDRFAPAGTRIHTEVIGPLMLRVFAICYRGGFFPDPPEEVMSRDSKGENGSPILPGVSFQSKLALALRAMENKSLMDFQEISAQMVEADPEVLDNFDSDTAFIDVGRNLGVPEKWLRESKDVKKIRDERAQARREQEQLQAAAMKAQAAGNLGKAPPELVERMADGVNGNGQ